MTTKTATVTLKTEPTVDVVTFEIVGDPMDPSCPSVEVMIDGAVCFEAVTPKAYREFVEQFAKNPCYRAMYTAEGRKVLAQGHSALVRAHLVWSGKLAA